MREGEFHHVAGVVRGLSGPVAEGTAEPVRGDFASPHPSQHGCQAHVRQRPVTPLAREQQPISREWTTRLAQLIEAVNDIARGLR